MTATTPADFARQIERPDFVIRGRLTNAGSLAPEVRIDGVRVPGVVHAMIATKDDRSYDEQPVIDFTRLTPTTGPIDLVLRIDSRVSGPGDGAWVMETRPPKALSVKDQETGEPLTLDEFASAIADLVPTNIRPERNVRLAAGEVQAIASLLGELSAVYSGDALGEVAARLSGSLYRRLGA